MRKLMLRIVHFPLFAVTGMFLSGCAGSGAAFKDMSPTPTASISGEWLTLRLGQAKRDITLSVQPKMRIEGGKVYVTGFHTHSMVSKEISTLLTAPGQVPIKEVFWVNPDGTKTSVPLAAEAALSSR